MSIKKSFPIRGHLTTFFLGLSLLTALLFGELLIRHFEYGIEDSVKMRLASEWLSFNEVRLINPEAKLPKSYVVSFYYDQLPGIKIDGKDVLRDVTLTNNEFTVVFVDETVTNDIKKEAVIGVYRFTLENGRSVFGVARYDYRLIGDTIDVWFDHRFNLIIYIALGYIFFIVLALWLYSYQVGKKTEQLVEWSESASNDLLTNPAPNFKFSEYNRVALYLEKALSKNAHLVEREQRFLSHASHELRTPIAIIRANMEILERISLPSDLQRPINRIDRASSNMQQITETMLWLVRKSETPPNQNSVSIAALLDNLIEELEYLIQGEEIDIIRDYAHAPTIKLPETPIKIVVGNLIRNAFQYTHSGTIRVYFEKNSIVIKNINTQELDLPFQDSFGLGQDLTEKICKKLGWYLEAQEIEGGLLARLHLPITPNTNA
ncbi:HAMP domain-containing histidine kinase [Vibrio splendidus]|uniref:sensor histidine kinase n=1 Tax=Vibrio TaxID=662 RepID=UPI0002D47F0E|nr:MULTISPECIES: HAMP domain-containing sensor histidine kinase [Vibrio]MBB1465377.1 HAMP domain-containing histidine kinase [Vibrio sp. SG41-7]MDH5910573.1 HAMP domain-containing histidine kinase [Vibrio splendidus]MDH5943798.1 HAMP domain-containing histidine kinase [Vibrio splendidus]MDH5983431.1 HAMP domain-containing histidine kinase [Vibrio splendidus]MDH5995523.1 HAMP domain-containing histidine kinase [Vibrio splendidus]